MKLILDYDEVKERLLKAESEDEGFKEKLDNMETPLISDKDWDYLVELICGKKYSPKHVDVEDFLDTLPEMYKYYYSIGLAKIAGFVEKIYGKMSSIYEFINGEKYEGQNDDDVPIPELLDDDDDVPLPEFSDDDDGYEDENVELIEIEYKKLREFYESFNVDPGEREDLEQFMSYLKSLLDKDKKISESAYISLVCCTVGSFIYQDDIFKIDTRDLEKFVAKVKRDFDKLKRENDKLLAEQTTDNGEKAPEENNDEKEQGREGNSPAIEDDGNLAKKEDEFLTRWCNNLEIIHKTLKKNKDFNKIKPGKPRIRFKYVASKVKSKFNFGALNPKGFLESMKKYGGYALGGAVVGLGAATLIPASTIVAGAAGVISTAKIVLASAKFANKVVSKFIGGPTPVDKLITSLKEGIKNFEIRVNYPDSSVDSDEEKLEAETIKFSETKCYKAIKKINDFLKNPKVQWFINGAAIGYKIGDALDLNEKFTNWLQSNKTSNTQVTVPNGTQGLETGPSEPNVTEPTVPETTVPETTVPEATVPETTVPETTVPEATVPETIVPETTVPETTVPTESQDYRWLDAGNDGDKLDLSGMKKGYNDSYAARGAYTGEYAHLNKSVNLATKYATLENGTFIKELRLADGSVFTGNIGDLLETGIDPSKIAARIANQNGDYAWMNLEDILEVLEETTKNTRGR